MPGTTQPSPVTDQPATDQLLNLGFNLFAAPAVVVANQLGLPALLARGPQTAEELAAASGTEADALGRFLRFLASLGVATEVEPGRYSIGELGRRLQPDDPNSLHHVYKILGYFLPLLPHMADAVKTGLPPFETIMGGPFFAWLAHNGNEAEIFGQGMTDFARITAPAVTEAYDFSQIRTLVDVAAGHGHLLRSLLAANPELHGVLFDMPHVTEVAQKALAEAGLNDRCDVVSGDFFTSIPTGGDAYVLGWILHDWDEASGLRILGNIHQAMEGKGKLLVLEAVLPDGDVPHFGKALDMTMLLCLRGRERTASEWADYLARANFKVTGVTPTNSFMSVVEAVPV